jgi:LuxR family maltose regulon positive regulatory protein
MSGGQRAAESRLVGTTGPSPAQQAGGADDEATFERLMAQGQSEEAVNVFVGLAQKWASVRRSDLLTAALARLSLDKVVEDARACLWVGHAMLGTDERQAIVWFERAAKAAVTEDRRCVELLAVSAAVIAHALGPGGGQGLALVIERLNRVLGRLGSPSEPSGQAVMQVALLAARLFGPPGCIDANAARNLVDGLLAQLTNDELWPTPHMQLAAAVVVLEYTLTYEGYERARHVALGMMPLVVDSEASALLRGRWWVERAWLYASDEDLGTFNRCLAEIDALANHGLPQLRFQRLRLQCVVAMRRGDDAAAAALLPEMECLAEHLSMEDQREFGRLSAGVLLLNGRPQDALRRAEAALGTAPLEAHNAGQLRLPVLEYAYALSGNGRPAEAAALLRRLMALDPGSDDVHFRSAASAYDYFASGGTDRQALRRCLAEAAAESNYRLLVREPQALAQLCDAALRAGIEPVFVDELIKRRKLKPPHHASGHWPWPVRVFALGAFRLECSGTPYRPSHKAQDKVLELLKLLVAAELLVRGPAKRGWLMDRMWPDHDPANARKALDMTIARLRRLLGTERAVLVSEGRVSLGSDTVWTDVSLLQASVDRIQQLRDARVASLEARTEEIRSEVAAMLAALRGRFLEGDEDTGPWVMGARAQVSRSVRALLFGCESLFAEGAGHDFVSLLEQALRADPSSEEMTRMLMRHYLRRGDHGEALQAYRRCRDWLHSELGIPTSNETEQLRQEIQSAAQGNGSAARGVIRA